MVPTCTPASAMLLIYPALILSTKVIRRSVSVVGVKVSWRNTIRGQAPFKLEKL